MPASYRNTYDNGPESGRVRKQLTTLGLAAALVAGGAGAAAVSSNRQNDVYCTDSSNRIVNESDCRSGTGGSHFIRVGRYGSNLPEGTVLNSGERVAYDDAAGRERLGLSRSGPVAGSGGLGGKVSASAGKGGVFSGSHESGG